MTGGAGGPAGGAGGPAGGAGVLQEEPGVLQEGQGVLQEDPGVLQEDCPSFLWLQKACFCRKPHTATACKSSVFLSCRAV